MYNFLLCLYHYCCYFFQFIAFTRISIFLLKLLCLTTINKVHQKNMVKINFVNKQEKKKNNNSKKNGINSCSGGTKLGKNTGSQKGSHGKMSSGNNLVTYKKFSHFFPTFSSLMKCIIQFKYP